MEIFPYSKYKNGIMSEVHERLEEIVSSFDGGKTDFAKALGIDFKTQRNYLNGKTKPSFDFLVGLHQMGQDVMYVLTGEKQVPDGFINIPRLAAVGSMGAGVDGGLPHEEVIDHITVSVLWLRRNLPALSSFKNLHLITGHGDSMSGTFEDGSALFVDSGVQEFAADGIYVFNLEGDIFVKRLQKMPKGRIMVISDNQVYQPFYIEHGDQFNVIGRVVGSWKFNEL